MASSDKFDPSLPWTRRPHKRHVGTISGRIHVSFQLVFSVIYAWYCFHLPTSGKAVLALTAAAVLMTISEVGPWHKAVWLVLVFALMFVENQSINQDRNQAQKDQEKAFSIANKTASTATQTLTSVVLLGSRLDDLSGQIKDAQKNNNAQLVAQLEKEKQKAKRQLLIATVPSVADQLRKKSSNFYNAWIHLNDPFNEPKRPSEETLGQYRQDRDKEIKLLQSLYQDEMKPLIANANYLRSQLLQGMTKTPHDGQIEVDNFGANQDILKFNAAAVADYLDDLAKRVSSQP